MPSGASAAAAASAITWLCWSAMAWLPVPVVVADLVPPGAADFGEQRERPGTRIHRCKASYLDRFPLGQAGAKAGLSPTGADPPCFHGQCVHHGSAPAQDRGDVVDEGSGVAPECRSPVA